MLSTYLPTIWSFLNSPIGTTIIKEGTSDILKGLIDRWKKKKSEKPSLTKDDLKKDLDENYNDKQLQMLNDEIKELSFKQSQIPQKNEKGPNIGNNYGDISITYN